MVRDVLRGVVAIDGPSGTGKSTVARRLASDLHAGYLNTGAMYRAVTLAVLRAGVPIGDPARILALLPGIELLVGVDPDRPYVLLNGEDVAAGIRAPAVTAAVSAVSAVPGVRAEMVALQRRLIDRTLARVGGIVVEGRDIGTVVVPDAGLKVFLTATATTRAQRRAAQDGAEGWVATVDATLVDVQRRDRFDSTRLVSPLRAAEDAVVLDTTELDVDGVLRRLHELVSEGGMVAPVVRA